MRKRLMAATAIMALAIASQGLAQSRGSLPITQPPFAGVIGDTISTSKPVPFSPIRAPQGAPNIFLFMGDDVGFAMSSAFGGPVPTPNMERLAAQGQRYNRFHTTSICSATRAALLTGRNHHNAATGLISDSPMGYPGYDGHIPPSTASIAQVLRLNGYSTAMFGKWHNVPPGETSAAGPFDRWPTGQGFEYFFGFPQGEADQWHPNIFRGTSLLPDDDASHTILDHRLADDAISWVHNQKAASPDKPFFVYFAPGSTHAPQQAPADYIARFKGKFHQGWYKLREETYQRQLAMGIIPRGTKLTPRPAEIAAWSSISPTEQAFAERSMEVAAAMLAYQDAQLGRVLDELDRMGVADNTLFVTIQGDNGASGEGGPQGSPDVWATIGDHMQRVADDNIEVWQKAQDSWLASTVDKLGSDQTSENYPVGWAWAMDTPLRWVKQYASMLGGIRNGMIVSWKGHIAHPNSICSEFGHVVDIAPTLLEAAHLPAPGTVYGVAQKPLDGQSLLPSLTKCEPDKPRTQYFELVGKAGLYQDGWFASNDDGRVPWQGTPPGGPNPAPNWKLYALRKDFAQSDDVSAKYPDRLKQMIDVWHQEAVRNNVFPLNHEQMRGRMIAPSGRKRFDLWGKDVSLPAAPDGLFAPNPLGGSFTVDADIVLDKDAASGVIVALGSHFAGWSLFLEDGRPTFVYAKSTRPTDVTRIQAADGLKQGTATLHMDFTSKGFGQGAHVQITNGGTILASGDVPATFLIPADVGEMLDAGRDTGATVTEYRTPHGRIEGDVRHVVILAK